MKLRNIISAILAFIGGLYFFLHFILPNNVAGVEWKQWHSEISSGFLVVSSLTVGLGLLNLILTHGQKFLYRRSGWQNSVVLLLSLLLMLIISSMAWKNDSEVNDKINQIINLKLFSERIIADGLLENNSNRVLLPINQRGVILAKDLKNKITTIDKFINSNKIEETSEILLNSNLAIKKLTDSSFSISKFCSNKNYLESKEKCIQELKAAGDIIENNIGFIKIYLEQLNRQSYVYKINTIIYEGLFVALGSSIFSLLGFYIVAAAFKAFRIRSLESAVMMIAALIVMLGQISVGYFLWEELPNIRMWILQVPNTAAFRAIAIGSGVAGLVLGLRMWFSIQGKSFKK